MLVRTFEFNKTSEIESICEINYMLQCMWRHVICIILTYCPIFVVFFGHVFLLICANDLLFIYVPNCSACSDYFNAIMHYFYPYCYFSFWNFRTLRNNHRQICSNEKKKADMIIIK